jgi:hypothetical protein
VSRRRIALAAAIVLAVPGLAGCGGTRDEAPASAGPAPSTASSPAPACRGVPRATIRLIASHGSPRTRFDAGDAAAVDVGSGYAVSLVAVAGGRQRMATWFVDKLRRPGTVASGNVQALQVTNWPLQSLDSEQVRQSQICAAKNARGVGPLAP